jgi:hypothetical protein
MFYNALNAGPNHSGNYTQPNTSKPTVHPSVANYPVGTNVLNLSWPIPIHVETNNPTHPTPPFPLSLP